MSELRIYSLILDPHTVNLSPGFFSGPLGSGLGYDDDVWFVFQCYGEKPFFLGESELKDGNIFCKKIQKFWLKHLFLIYVILCIHENTTIYLLQFGICGFETKKTRFQIIVSLKEFFFYVWNVFFSIRSKSVETSRT